MKRGGLISKRYKQIQIYLFNDLFLWVSARGKFKGSYSFYAEDLEIEIPADCKKGDALFSIGLKKEKHKRLIVCADDVQRDKTLNTVVQTYRQCQETAKKTLEGTDKTAIHRLKKKSVRETTVKDTDVSFSPSSVDTRNLREYSMEESDISKEHNGSGIMSPIHHKTQPSSSNSGFDDSQSRSARNGQSYSHLPQIKGLEIVSVMSIICTLQRFSHSVNAMGLLQKLQNSNPIPILIPPPMAILIPDRLTERVWAVI